MLLISARQLRELVPMRAAVDAVRQAFIDVSRGGIEQPTRLALEGGTALAMLARDRATGGTVLKGITIRPHNPAAGVPAVQAVVCWFDGATGTPLALIDGTALTAMRTGAASGAATELLARRDAAVLAMIGAGGQAADQVRAVCAVRPIREVRIAARTPARVAPLVETLGRELAPISFVAASGVGEALAGADVVCTATDAEVPLFALDDLPGTVHVNAIGAYTERMCELPADLLAAASALAVDRIDVALVEAGDVLQAVRAGRLTTDRLVELGDLLARGDPPPGGRTVFKSVGIAAQDWALARLAVDRALASATLIPRFEP